MVALKIRRDANKIAAQHMAQKYEDETKYEKTA
jgi:hypothetical protein